MAWGQETFIAMGTEASFLLETMVARPRRLEFFFFNLKSSQRASRLSEVYKKKLQLLYVLVISSPSQYKGVWSTWERGLKYLGEGLYLGEGV